MVRGSKKGPKGRTVRQAVFYTNKLAINKGITPTVPIAKVRSAAELFLGTEDEVGDEGVRELVPVPELASEEFVPFRRMALRWEKKRGQAKMSACAQNREIRGCEKPRNAAMLWSQCGKKQNHAPRSRRAFPSRTHCC